MKLNDEDAKQSCKDEGAFLAEPEANLDFTLLLTDGIERHFPTELKKGN